MAERHIPLRRLAKPLLQPCDHGVMLAFGPRWYVRALRTHLAAAQQWPSGLAIPNQSHARRGAQGTIQGTRGVLTQHTQSQPHGRFCALGPCKTAGCGGISGWPSPLRCRPPRRASAVRGPPATCGSGRTAPTGPSQGPLLLLQMLTLLLRPDLPQMPGCWAWA